VAVINTLLTTIDSTATAVGGSAYGAVSTAILPIWRLGAIIAVALTGANLAIQAIPMTLQNGVSLMLRISLVYIFLSSFANFDAVYGVLTDAPSQFGGLVLDQFTGGGVTNLYDGLDKLYLSTLTVGDKIAQNGGYISGALAALILFLVAALMAVAAVVMIGAAKLMIAILIIIGPIAITATLFKQTAPIFEAYVKLALGFAFVPLIAAAMAGFTIVAAQSVLPTNLDSIKALSDVVSFIVVMILGTGLMLMVPSVASSIAQTGIGLMAPAAATFMMGRNAMRMGASAAGAGGRGISGGVQAIRGKELASTASTATKVGFRTVNTVAYLASRMKK